MISYTCIIKHDKLRQMYIAISRPNIGPCGVTFAILLQKQRIAWLIPNRKFYFKIDGNLNSDLFGTYSGSKRAPKYGPGACILHTSQSSFNSIRNKFHVNPVETFYMIDENLPLIYFGPIRGPKEPKIWPLTAHILQASTSSSSERENQVSWESSGSLLQNGWKTYF